MTSNLALVVEIDEAELAVCMCEASYGIARPRGMTAIQALDEMDEDCRNGWLRAARVAIGFLRGAIREGKRPQ